MDDLKNEQSNVLKIKFVLIFSSQ